MLQAEEGNELRVLVKLPSEFRSQNKPKRSKKKRPNLLPPNVLISMKRTVYQEAVLSLVSSFSCYFGTWKFIIYYDLASLSGSWLLCAAYIFLMDSFILVMYRPLPVQSFSSCQKVESTRGTRLRDGSRGRLTNLHHNSMLNKPVYFPPLCYAERRCDRTTQKRLYSLDIFHCFS